MGKTRGQGHQRPAVKGPQVNTSKQAHLKNMLRAPHLYGVVEGPQDLSTAPWLWG